MPKLTWFTLRTLEHLKTVFFFLIKIAFDFIETCTSSYNWYIRFMARIGFFWVYEHRAKTGRRRVKTHNTYSGLWFQNGHLFGILKYEHLLINLFCCEDSFFLFFRVCGHCGKTGMHLDPQDMQPRSVVCFWSIPETGWLAVKTTTTTTKLRVNAR